MKLIRQKFKTDCGVASFAMLAGISWERAKQLLHPNADKQKNYSYSTSGEAILNASKKLGITPVVRSKKLTLNTKIKDLTYSAYIVIKYTEKTYHAIVWDADNKRILDPDRFSFYFFNPHFHKFYQEHLFQVITFHKAK